MLVSCPWNLGQSALFELMTTLASTARGGLGRDQVALPIDQDGVPALAAGAVLAGGAHICLWLVISTTNSPTFRELLRRTYDAAEEPDVFVLPIGRAEQCSAGPRQCCNASADPAEVIYQDWGATARPVDSTNHILGIVAARLFERRGVPLCRFVLFKRF